MNCVCYNIMNRIQTEIGNLVSTVINQRINSGTPTSDEGDFHPNLNLLEPGNSNFFNINIIFYICLIILTIATLSTMTGSRRRRLGGNTSTLN